MSTQKEKLIFIYLNILENKYERDAINYFDLYIKTRNKKYLKSAKFYNIERIKFEKKIIQLISELQSQAIFNCELARRCFS